MRKVLILTLVISAFSRASAAELDSSEIGEKGLSLLKTFNTGSAIDIPGLARSMTDLIPNLQINFGDGDVSEDGEIRNIGITYSPSIENIVDFGVTVNLEKPDIYSAFVEQELITEEQAGELANNFELGDSKEFEVSFSYLGEVFGVEFGRKLGAYTDTLDSLVDIANEAAEYRWSQLQSSSPFGIQARNERTNLLRSILASNCGPIGPAVQQALNSGAETSADFEQSLESFFTNPALISNDSSIQTNCLSLTTEFIEQSVSIENQLAAYQQVLHESMTQIGVFQLTSMIAQQPQFVVNASHKDRDRLAGPDELSISLNYEWNIGGGNLNDYLNQIPAGCKVRVSGASAESCLTSIKDYLNKADVRTNDQFRAAISGEFRQIDGRQFNFADPIFSFQSEESESWGITGSLYWQKYLNPSDDTPIVFEGSLKHSNNNSEMMNDQNMASISATKVLGGINWTTAVIWSDEPEFKFQHDKDDVKFSFGFNYKL